MVFCRFGVRRRSPATGGARQHRSASAGAAELPGRPEVRCLCAVVPASAGADASAIGTVRLFSDQTDQTATIGGAEIRGERKREKDAIIIK